MLVPATGHAGHQVIPAADHKAATQITKREHWYFCTVRSDQLIRHQRFYDCARHTLLHQSDLTSVVLMENMSLWSLAVPSGAKGVTAEVEQHASVLTYVHITNCALPPNPADGPHTLVISRSGVDVALATLEKGKQLQHSLDFILDATTVFKVVGPASSKSAIHLIGYQTSSVIEDSEDQDMYGMEDEDEDDEDEDDDEEAPEGVPINKVAMNGKGGKKAAARQEEDDDDDDEDEDFEMSDDDLVGEVEDDEDEEGEEDDEGEDEDEDDEEEEEAAKPGSKRPHVSTGTPLTPAPKKIQVEQGKGKAAPATAPPKVAAGAKGGKEQQQQKPGQQQQQQKGGQQPQQQQKGGQQAQQQQKGQQTPGAGAKPAQKQQGGATPGDGPKNDAEYEAALTAFLKTQPNKSAAIAALGTKVKKPSASFKITNFIKSKADKFKLDANGQNVTLLG